MNSTSSTDVPASAMPPASAKASAGLRPWQFFLTASFIGAAATVWLAPPGPPEALLFMSLAVFAAGGCAIALHAVLSALSGRSAAEREISASARETLEREKLLTLRALKDLEFDKAMGKVSAADSAPMEARLRDRAMAIMRDLDGRAALRARIEEDLAARQATGDRPQATGLCNCGTVNDPDARFCKNCGIKL
jgi:hypothetical protein